MIAALAALAPLVSFADDGYIQSNGDRGFNTGYMITPNTKIELDFELTSVVDNSGKQLLAIESPYDTGSSFATTVPRFEVYVGGITAESGMFSLRGSKSDGTAQVHNLCAADTFRHTMVIDLPASSGHFKLYTNGNEVFSSTNAYTTFLEKNATIPLVCSAKRNATATSPTRPRGTNTGMAPR